MIIDSPPLQGAALISALLADDKAAHALGLELVQAGIGRVQARMRVHSHGIPMVAAGASIEFLRLRGATKTTERKE